MSTGTAGMGEPDVYETSDLPEVDQPNAASEPESDSVERLNVSMSDAYNQFKGKTLHTKAVDFSDNIGVGRKSGYYLARSEYELLDEEDIRQKKETPEQRLQRLQLEVRELLEDVNKVKDAGKKSGDEGSQAGGVSPVALCKQVQCLDQQLQDLTLDKLLGEQATAAGSNLAADPHAALQKRLLQELEAYKSRASKAAAAAGSGAGKAAAAAGGTPLADGDCVSFQLYYRPEQANFSSNARVAELEQRLDRMEALLGGQNTEKMNSLTAEVEVKNLLGVVSSLMSRVKMLDPAQVELVEARLSTVNHRLNQLTEKKESLEQLGKTSKVGELYELIQRWDPIAASLPSVVDRLSLLKDLHEQALQFSQTMKRLETTQQQIEKILTTQSDQLKQVDGTVKENLSVIQTNCEKLSERLAALNK